MMQVFIASVRVVVVVERSLDRPQAVKVMPEHHGEHSVVWPEARPTSFFWDCDEVVPLRLRDRIGPVEWVVDALVESHGDWSVRHAK